MRVCCIKIENFRGIRFAEILLPKHGVLIGDNNTGKTTVLEALDLVLGPDRLNRRPPIDEHDFFGGSYRAQSKCDEKAQLDENQADEENAPESSDGQVAQDDSSPQGMADVSSTVGIVIEATIADLNDEQRAHFGDSIEFWNDAAGAIHTEPDLEALEGSVLREAIRVTFLGRYDEEEDDFDGQTFFSRSLAEADSPARFAKKDKLVCGFLYLRSIRTGARALSLERGSLLDIVLRLKDVRPQIWEDTITELESTAIGNEPDHGISGVLESVNHALKRYVPREWGIAPHLRVSKLTRSHLREVVTAFIGTGAGTHAAPFYRQGTGSVNLLVLAMLSIIAEAKQNVVFAMEEPETAIPPYAQKQIVSEVRKSASQTLFTSHSPYVMEEFSTDETVVLSRTPEGDLSRHRISLPKGIKLKRYRQEFRTRFSEGLLARRVLIAEGATEAHSFPTVCRRLAELNPTRYSSLESLGICTLDAGSQDNICGVAELFKGLGKKTYALCDSRNPEDETKIGAAVHKLFMHDEKGFEDLVLNNTTDEALARHALSIDWPPHLSQEFPDPAASPKESMAAYFKSNKGNWGTADFLAQCGEEEIPEWLRTSCAELKLDCTPGTEQDNAQAPGSSSIDSEKS